MVTLFSSAFFVGTAAIAGWLYVRAPKLAPRGLVLRGVLCFVILEIAPLVPIESTTYVGLYTSVFGGLMPVLVAMWLSAFWLLRGLSDAMFARL